MVVKLFRLILIVVLFSSVAQADEIEFVTRPLQILSADGKKQLFTVEVADTETKREHGLMLRKDMPENNGMLFLFDKARAVTMWMKDTYMPLDMVFIKSGGIIRKITQAKSLSLESIFSGGKVIAVLELNAGTCKKLGINKNDKVVF